MASGASANTLDPTVVLGQLYELVPGRQVIIEYDHHYLALKYEDDDSRRQVMRYVNELLASQRCLVFWKRLGPAAGRQRGIMVRVVVGVSPRAVSSLDESVKRWWDKTWAERYRKLRNGLELAD